MVFTFDIDAERKEWWLDQPRECFKHLSRISIDKNQEWFEVYKLDNSTYAIHEPGVFQEVLTYLVIGENNAVLLDTGMGIGNIKLVVDELTEKPVSVINTHSHLDHLGGNHLFSDIAIYDDSNAIETMQMKNDYWRRYEKRILSWKPWPKGFTPETFRIYPSNPTRLLYDKDRIELGGRTLEVLHAPGHCPDEIVLFDRAKRGLFTGDAFYLARLYAHGPSSDLDVYYNTAKRLANLIPEVDWLYPSHKETKGSSTKLSEMVEAFQKILNGTAKFEIGEMRPNFWVKNYRFNGFSVLVRKL